MRDRSDRYRVHPLSSALAAPKRLGNYLVEAGLLTTDQICVILNDQQATGMRFGEIIVARGWLKEQTIEWIVEKVVEPERQAQTIHQENTVHQENTASVSNHLALPQKNSQPQHAAATPRAAQTTSSAETAQRSQKPFTRREVPISKPLPSVNTSDSDVNWVG